MSEPAGLDVLLIEDNPDDCAWVKRALTPEFTLAIAMDAFEAQSLLHTYPKVKLILLDLRLPLMSGWTLHERLRVLPQLATVPIVLLSGVPDVQDHCIRLGAAGYVRKPSSDDHLRGVVRRFCRPETDAGSPSGT